MITSLRFATIALTACLLGLPVSGSAEAVIGAKLLSAPPSLVQEQTVRRQSPQPTAFNWMANGSSGRTAGAAKAVQTRYRVITGKGSWICSPAGFGQRSHCHAG
jgi:hypothetical protein